MRLRIALVPLGIAAALLSGCTGTPTSTPTTPAPTPTVAATPNGVEALTAEEILSKATAALAAAKSFKAKGDDVDEAGKMSLDLTFSGANGQGSVTVPDGTFELIKVDSILYLKAAPEFWKDALPEGAGAATLLLKDKYVKMDSTVPLASVYGAIFDPAEFLKPDGAFTKGETSTINGTPAVALIASKDNSKLFIATTGEPLPLRIEGKPGVFIDFTNFGAAVEVKAPSADQVIDYATLPKG